MRVREIKLVPERGAGGMSGPTKADAELSELARALGHPVRAAIVRLLLHRGECVCGDIVDRVPLAQATVSQHLKVLREAGWIAGEVDGPRVCYCAEPKTLNRFRALLEALESRGSGRGRDTGEGESS